MSGKLTNEDRKNIEAWLTQRVKHFGSCSICGHSSWTLMDHFVHAPIFYGAGVISGGPAYPCFGLICDNCGKTHFLNAVTSGIVVDENKKPSKKVEATDEQ